VYTVFLAEKSSNIRSYTGYLYGFGQPYAQAICNWSVAHTLASNSASGLPDNLMLCADWVATRESMHYRAAPAQASTPTVLISATAAPAAPGIPETAAAAAAAAAATAAAFQRTAALFTAAGAAAARLAVPPTLAALPPAPPAPPRLSTPDSPHTPSTHTFAPAPSFPPSPYYRARTTPLSS
jgi:hypothetical protein